MSLDLRLGDCLDVLPDKPDSSVDMVLTDLPYGVLSKQNDASACAYEDRRFIGV